MEDLIAQKDHLQAQYDATKEAIANGEEEYNENFAAITDGLGIAHFSTDPLRALELLKEALLIRRDKICPGQDDESVITSLNNVSIILRKLLPSMPSLLMKQRQQEQEQEQQQKEEEQTDKSLTNEETILKKQNDQIAEAMDYQRQAVEMFCRLYSDSRHLNAAANLNTLVEALDDYKLGTEEEKIRFLRMAIDRFKKSFAEEKTMKPDGEENDDAEEKQKSNDDNDDDNQQQQETKPKNDDDENHNDQKQQRQGFEDIDKDAPDPNLLHYASTLRNLAKRLGSSEEATQLREEADKIGNEMEIFERRLMEREKELQKKNDEEDKSKNTHE